MNFLIEGDNLAALRLLEKTHNGKIDVIYIDPPYNTGKKDFIYDDAYVDTEDGFKHSKWISFMEKRLLIIKRLMKLDSYVCISIDINEQANLKMLCDSIFGEDNQIACMPRRTKSSGKTTNKISANHDYLLIYAVNAATAAISGLEHVDKGFKFEDEFVGTRGKYKLNQTLDYNSLQYSSSLDYPLEIEGEVFYPGSSYEKHLERKQGHHNRADWAWRWSKDLFDFGYNNGFIVIKRKKDGSARIYTKTYLNASIVKGMNGYEIKIITRTKPLSSLEFTDKEPHITGFSMVRYVDDLYILFNSDLSENAITPIVNRIVNAYSSELKKLNLSLNREKTLWKLTSDISEELKKSLYDEQFNGTECNITDFVDSNLLLKFLEDVKELLFNHNLDTNRYLELINETFNIPQTEYTPQEIYNSLVYKKHPLFNDAKIVEILFDLVSFDYNFLKLDTKRFTIMLLKTQNRSLIKAMLSKLFEANRKGVWNIYDTSLAINYLLQRDFSHADLLRILKDEEQSVHLYYELFCKSSFITSIEQSNQKYIRRFGSSIFYEKDDKLFFLYFMYMVEMEKNNYLSAFAYYKNFFDRISAHLAYTINGDHAKKKPNYKGYYKEGAFKSLYAGITDADKIIGKAHEIRNSNPLSHSSAELVDNNKYCC